MKPLIALALFPLTAWAVEIPLDFTIENTSTATATYRVGTVPTSLTSIYTTTITYSGNMLATAEVNPDTGAIESFEFTGGSIATPDLSPILDVYVGTVLYKVLFSTTGIKRIPESSAPDPMTGGYPNGSLHTTDFSDGTLNTTNYSPDFNSGVVSYTIPLAESGTYLIGPNIIYPITIGSSPTSSSTLTRTFSANFYSPINLPPRFGYTQVPVAGWPGRDFTHDYREEGSLYASASFTIPTEYGQWAIDNGLTLTTGEEVNAAGMPYALLFAFDLPAESASLPLTFSSTPTPIVQLTLPASGLGFTVLVEYASDPGSAFTPLPDENFLSGTDSLDAGQTAPATLSFPTGAQGFLRFYVEL